MATGIVEIATQAVVLIAAATPDVEPSITYREASPRLPLAELPPLQTAQETTRQFQALPGRLGGAAEAGPYLEVVQELLVQIRYALHPEDQGAHRRLLRLAHSDATRIYCALTRPPLATSWTGILSDLQLTEAGEPEPTQYEHVWLVTHRFTAQYQIS